MNNPQTPDRRRATRASASWHGFVVAAATVGLATLLRLALDPLFGDSFPFTTYFLAASLVAAFGRTRDAVFCLGAGGVLGVYLFTPPRYVFAPTDASVLSGLILYLLIGSAIVGMSHATRTARSRAELLLVKAAEQRERLRVTVDSIGDAVVITDTESRVTNLNRVAATLTGWSAAEATGMPLETVFRIVNETTRQAVENPVTRALREGMVVGLANHTILISKDGTERPIDDSAAPIRDGTGAVVGCVLVFRDIAERRAAERRLAASEARKTAILDAALDGIITIDHLGRVVDFNPAAERTFGHTRANVLGRDMGDLIIPPVHRERHRDGMARYLVTGEGPVLNRRIELAALRADGTEFPVEVSITPIPQDGPPLFTGHIRDITERKRAEDLLRASEERAAFVLASSGIGFWFCDLPFDVLEWDERVKAHFWLPPDAVVTIATFYDRMHPDDREPTRTAIDRSIADRTPYDTEYRTIDPESGAVKWVRAIGRTFYTTEGTPARFDGLTLDVTARRTAEQSARAGEERFRTLFESMDEGFCVVELMMDADERPIDFRYLEINPAFEKHTGLAPRVGQTLRELVPTHLAPELPLFAGIVATGEPRRFENEVRAIGRWLDVYAYRVGGPGSRKVGILFTDITERKRSENELRQLAADLSEADRRKDEFLAQLAHELRNPLAPIRNGLQVLRLSHGRDAKFDKPLSMMERQLGQMVRLVDDLLDMSRISRGKMTLHKERGTLAAIIDQAVETSRPQIEAEEHAFTLKVPAEPIFVDADATRLAQVVSNLLNNAAKYTDRGGHIRLAVERAGEEATIRVRDTGIGISPDMLPRVFDLFTQVDLESNRSQGGLGIGLTLVKRLVEMHGGTVEARSEGRGRGSEFVVRVPTVPEPRSAKAESRADRPAGRFRILVADDNVDSAESLSMLLTIMGSEVRAVHDGQAAVDAFEPFGPDIVFLDIGMPRLTGYEACRRIRERPAGRRAVMVALTGWGQDEDRRKSLEAGFDQHLVKPVAPADLEKLLADVRLHVND